MSVRKFSPPLHQKQKGVQERGYGRALRVGIRWLILIPFNVNIFFWNLRYRLIKTRWFHIRALIFSPRSPGVTVEQSRSRRQNSLNDHISGLPLYNYIFFWLKIFINVQNLIFLKKNKKKIFGWVILTGNKFSPVGTRLWLVWNR